jgi:hypothetical protein
MAMHIAHIAKARIAFGMFFELSFDSVAAAML